jgi:hypothetical protein
MIIMSINHSCMKVWCAILNKMHFTLLCILVKFCLNMTYPMTQQLADKILFKPCIFMYKEIQIPKHLGWNIRTVEKIWKLVIIIYCCKRGNWFTSFFLTWFGYLDLSKQICQICHNTDMGEVSALYSASPTPPSPQLLHQSLCSSYNTVNVSLQWQCLVRVLLKSRQHGNVVLKGGSVQFSVKMHCCQHDRNWEQALFCM